MVNPSTQHLYILQNEFGLIKIGRSVDPLNRKRQIRTSDGCKAEFVAIFEGGGEDEEAIHCALANYRLEGEWFDGTADVRAKVEAIFASSGPLNWVCDRDFEGASVWLAERRAVNDVRYVLRELHRTIEILEATTNGNASLDRIVLRCQAIAVMGEPQLGLRTERSNDGHSWLWKNWRTEKVEPVPFVTTSVDASLQVWPDGMSPINWEGSALECCAAALGAYKAQIPTLSKRWRGSPRTSWVNRGELNPKSS